MIVTESTVMVKKIDDNGIEKMIEQKNKIESLSNRALVRIEEALLERFPEIISSNSIVGDFSVSYNNQYAADKKADVDKKESSDRNLGLGQVSDAISGSKQISNKNYRDMFKILYGVSEADFEFQQKKALETGVPLPVSRREFFPCQVTGLWFRMIFDARNKATQQFLSLGQKVVNNRVNDRGDSKNTKDSVVPMDDIGSFDNEDVTMQPATSMSMTPMQNASNNLQNSHQSQSTLSESIKF